MADQKKKLPQLYLYNRSSNKQIETLIAKSRYTVVNDARIKVVKDLNDVAAKINAEQKIAHLILSFHGYSGGLIIGNNAYDLDEEKVKTALTGKQNKRVAQVEKIDLLGCDIARKPSKLKSLAKLFGALQISAYTWPIVYHKKYVEISKGKSTEEVEKLLSDYQGYMLGQGDPARVAAQAKVKNVNVPLILVYGSKNSAIASFPLGFGQKNYFKALSEAKATEVRAANAAKADKDYNGIFVSFEYVTVKMK